MRIPDIGFLVSQFSILFLVIPVILILFISLYFYRKNLVDTYFREMRIQGLILERNFRNYMIQTICYCSAWLFAVIALMGPQGNAEYIDNNSMNESQNTSIYEGNRTRQFLNHDIIFYIDTSASMAVADLSRQRNRLDLTREISDELLSLLNGHNVAIKAFSSQVFQLVPLTLDLLFARLTLKNLSINEGNTPGTNFLHMLEDIETNYASLDNLANKPKTIFIFSDGGDTTFESATTDQQRNLRQNEILKKVQNIATLSNGHINIITIGLGSQNGSIVPGITYQGQPVVSKLDDTLLKLISDHIGGEYWTATALAPSILADKLLNQIKASPGKNEVKINSKEALKVKLEKEEDIVYQLFFQYPLFLSILSLAIALLIPETSGNKKATDINLLKYASKRNGFIQTIVILLILKVGAIYGLETEISKEIQTIEKRALVSFKTGLFNNALQEYSILLNTDKLNQFIHDQGQEATLYFNWATLLLAQGNSKKANRIFESIVPNSDPSPYFWYHLKAQLAYSISREVESTFFKEAVTSPTYPEDQQLAILYLEKASALVNESIDEYCRLERLMGSAQCDGSFVLLELREHILNLIKTHKIQLIQYEEDIKNILANPDEKQNESKEFLTLIQFVKNLLDIQRHAYLLQGLLLYQEKNAQDLKTFEALLQAQSKAIGNSNQFLSNVLGAQEYEQKNSNPLSQGCQQAPWELIVPLFQEGNEAANKALSQIKILKESKQNITKFELQNKQIEILNDQLNAISAWDRILKALNESRQSQHKSEQKTQEETEEKPDPDNKNQKQLQTKLSSQFVDEKMKQLFHRIEEMETSDQKFRKSEQKPQSSGERPW